MFTANTLRSLTTLSALALVPLFAQHNGRPELSNLGLELKTGKTAYLPGEMVTLQFRLAPRFGAALAPDRMSVIDGSLEILVSRGSDVWLEYQGPEWGAKKTTLPEIVQLQQGHAIEATATLLYNQVPETAHLSPMYARQELQGKLLTDYALGEAGPVLLKAVYNDRLTGDHLESNPVALQINEPAGEDAAVWNTLRLSPKLGYLVQTGMLPGPASEREEDEAAAALENLVASHPFSIYATHISQGLQRFRSYLQARRNN